MNFLYSFSIFLISFYTKKTHSEVRLFCIKLILSINPCDKAAKLLENLYEQDIWL